VTSREHLERETGIEPATNGLGSRYSTIELLPPALLAKYIVKLLSPMRQAEPPSGAGGADAEAADVTCLIRAKGHRLCELKT
jgi:hypothetical protein